MRVKRNARKDVPFLPLRLGNCFLKKRLLLGRFGLCVLVGDLKDVRGTLPPRAPEFVQREQLHLTDAI